MTIPKIAQTPVLHFTDLLKQRTTKENDDDLKAIVHIASAQGIALCNHKYKRIRGCVHAAFFFIAYTSKHHVTWVYLYYSLLNVIQQPMDDGIHVLNVACKYPKGKFIKKGGYPIASDLPIFTIKSAYRLNVQ